MKQNGTIVVSNLKIGLNHPTIFIADIAANHDNDIERAKDLIYLSAEAGANIVKFQHFTAPTIVSDYGFKQLKKQLSHQSSWKKSVFEVYEEASLNIDWTNTLAETCHDAGVTFMTSPYSKDLVDQTERFVPAFKIGSGDITWLEIITHIAKKNKPVFLATGASSLTDVKRAVNAIYRYNKNIVLMQCNTNYTASIENFRYLNLNVLKTYAEIFPSCILGLSDHTSGCSSVLGAVTLGARVIEKHFTDDNTRLGPDHKFSMTPKSWKYMVNRTRELEAALGDGIKIIEDNEKETVIVQRRSIRAKKYLPKGKILHREDIEILRPCPVDAIPPYEIDKILGRKLICDIQEGQHLKWTDIKQQ